MNKKNLTTEELKNIFLTACEQGDLGTVTYLLTRPDLTSDLEARQKLTLVGMKRACVKGNFPIVKYLVTSQEVTQNEIFNEDDLCIHLACLNGHLDVVKYFLTAPELDWSRSVNAEEDKENLLQTACTCQQFNMVKYLIVEQNVQRTALIDNFFNENEKEEKYKNAISYAKNLFLIQEEQKILSKIISVEPEVSVKKHKI